MNILNKYLKATSFFNILILIASCELVHMAAYAQIDETELGGLYRMFKPEYTYLSPVMGLLALKSGMLANIRFHGNYGAEQKEFLCHRQITHPPRNMPSTSDRDCPQDYTTAIIQHLFPSPTGSLLTISGTETDIFYHLDNTNIGKLLKAVSMGSEEEVGEAVDFILSKISSQSNLKRIGSAWKHLDSTNTNKGITTKLAAYYTTMFLGAKKEADNYPPHLIETALLALAVKRANHVSDLAPLLLELKGFTKDSVTATSYSKAFYDNFKRAMTQPGAVYNFSKLLEDVPEDLVFHTLAYDKYDSLYPSMLGTATTNYQGIPFSDCGESSLRNFFNIVLSDHKKRSFNTDYLTTVFPNADKALIDFYQNSQTSYDNVSDDKLRPLWAAVVSNRASVTYRNKNICNMASSDDSNNGLSNMLVLIGAILGDKNLSNLTNDEDKLDYLFKAFRRSDFKFDWHMKKNNEKLKNNEFNIIISINEYREFIWEFEIGHFELTKLSTTSSDSKQDWRKDDLPLLEIICSSKTDSNLLHALLPFYLPDQWFRAHIHMLNSLEPTQKALLGVSFLYGAKLFSSEAKLDTLNVVALLNSSIFKEIAPKWIHALPEDGAINKKLIVAYFNIQQAIRGFKLDRGESLLQSFFKGGINKCFEKIDIKDIFLNEKLTCKFMAENNLQDLIKKDLIKTKKLRKFIRWAIMAGHLEVVTLLLKQVPEFFEGVLAKKNIRDETVLHEIVKAGHLEVVKLLLEQLPNFTKEALASKNAYGHTLLHMAINRKNNEGLEMVKFLLSKAPKLAYGEVAKDRSGYTPLHNAISFDCLEIVKLIAQHMPRVELEAINLGINEIDAWMIIQQELAQKNRPIDSKRHND